MVRRRTASLCATALVLALGGCLGGGDDDAAKAPGGVLTVYLSLPGRGLSADEAASVEAGARLAFRQAHGHAGPHAVRLVRLDSTKASGEPWDPGQVQANAEKARDDPSAVAYIGELGLGASAVSVPVTNDGGLLQIAPLESLTSLTRAPPGRAARGAPDRYYPTGRRNFLRLVPSDLRVADLIAARVKGLGAERVALVTGTGVYAEELTSQLAERLRRDGRTVVPTDVIDDDPKTPRALVEQLTERAPDVIVYAGLGDRQAVRLLTTLARSLPATPVLTGAGLLERAPLRFGEAPARVEAFGPLAPVASYGAAPQPILATLRRARRNVSRPEALYGYAAARLVLAAVREGGARRAAVVQAALRPGRRRSVIGDLEVHRSGAVSGAPMTLFRLKHGVFKAAPGPG